MYTHKYNCYLEYVNEYTLRSFLIIMASIYHSFCRGVVAVSMDIQMLDIDQCPDKYHIPNAFKDTHKCDDKSSYVS